MLKGRAELSSQNTRMLTMAVTVLAPVAPPPVQDLSLLLKRGVVDLSAANLRQ